MYSKYSDNRKMKAWKVMLLFIFVRLCTVFIVQTWFVPDEYWQTVEVAHKIAFGYGHLTWEWTHGIRSYIYPAFLATVMNVLKYLNMDSLNAVILGPRILQALFSALGDYYFWSWYKNVNSSQGSWAIFALMTNWFWLYCGSRTLINSFEATLNTIALSLFPWGANKLRNKSTNFLLYVGIVCIVRPTASIMWLPLCIYHIFHAGVMVIKQYVFTGVVVACAGIMVDSYYYGKVTFTPLNFLQANIMQGINVFYGTHPLFWYMLVGIPVVLGCHLVPFLLGARMALKRNGRPILKVLLFTIVWTVAILSLVPHKEFRFLLPLMPIFVFIESCWLSQWSRRAEISVLWIVAAVIMVVNMALLSYFGLIHQRGTIDVMKELATKDPKHTNVIILMPCHSTPLYSHLHTSLNVSFLTCEPDFTGNTNYEDEADLFYNNPEKWLSDNYLTNETASHIVIYNSLHPKIKNFLERYSYKLNSSFYHTPHPSGRIGQYVEIYVKH